MTTRIVRSEHGRRQLVKLIEEQKLPFTITIADGKLRSVEQNRLQRLWMNEIAEQREDLTPEEARGYCKLTIGIPILRAENEAFRLQYDAIVKPLSYEQKIAMMMEPLDFPVTRLMKMKQKTKYLDGVMRHWSEQGVVLTCPDDMGFGRAA